MVEIKNYYFGIVEDVEFPIDPENFVKPFRVAGDVEGRGKIMTSLIDSIDGDVLTTQSGSHYKLVNKNPQYETILEAYREGIPIIHFWVMMPYNDNTYELGGYLGEYEFCAKVVAKSGDYLILEGGEKCLVNWLVPHPNQVMIMKKFNDMCDYKYPDDYEEFLSVKIKPILKRIKEVDLE